MKKDKYLLKMLLEASKKAITQKWLQFEIYILFIRIAFMIDSLKRLIFDTF